MNDEVEILGFRNLSWNNDFQMIDVSRFSEALTCHHATPVHSSIFVRHVFSRTSVRVVLEQLGRTDKSERGLQQFSAFRPRTRKHG